MKFSEFMLLMENRLMVSTKVPLNTSLPSVPFAQAEFTNVMSKRLKYIEDVLDITFHTVYSNSGKFINTEFFVVGSCNKTQEPYVFRKQKPGSMRRNTLYSKTHGLEAGILERERSVAHLGGISVYTNGYDDVMYRNKRGEFHRPDGPAFISANKQLYYNNGELHRLDGPAVITNKSENYYIHGIQYSKEEYHNIIKTVDQENIEDISDISNLF